MISRIIDFSARNRLIVLTIVAVAAIYGWWSMHNVALDAIPDLSDTQVIIYSRWDRSPDIIEDQVTYPIVAAMLGAPKVKAVRGFSDFGYSFVYVIFEDGTDIYWARTRTLEYLSSVLQTLPPGAKTELGPDATGLGWIYQYVLEDNSGKQSLADLRSLQDWYLRYHLKSVPGVAEVAPIGGFGKQYQVNVDPNRLQAYGIPINKVVEAIRGSNSETGGRMIEMGGAEYMVRGRGYAKSIADIESIVLTASENGTPIRVKDIGQVSLGPDIRRGVSDLDGRGEAVSGIIVMRQGENALDVIGRVKEKIRQVEPGLPEGVKIVPVYDRSQLIRNSIDTLSTTVIEVIITVCLVVLLFLWHIPSALIPMITIPIAVLILFIPFRAMGVTANIMSLGGIAIAIGAMVDAAIVVVEQAHKKLEAWEAGGRRGDYKEIVIAAVKEVGGTSFFALLVIAVSFIPVFALEAQEGRLFKPLAYTKTLGMIVAAFLAITLDPALRLSFTHLRNFNLRPRWLARVTNALFVGQIHSEDRHPVSRVLIRLYEPACRWSPAPQMGGDRRFGCAIPGDHPGFHGARIGVHAPPVRRGALLYALDDAGDFDRRGAAGAPGHRPADQGVPGGGPRIGQGRAGGDLHRSGAAVDAGDGDHAEAALAVAHRADLVFLLGAGLAQTAVPSLHARHDVARTAGRSDERRGEAPGRVQRVDDADQGAHRHAQHGHAHPGRAQDPWRRSGENPGDRHAGRGGAPLGERDPQRLRRADG